MSTWVNRFLSWTGLRDSWSPGAAPNPWAVPADPAASDLYHDGQWSPLIAPVLTHPDADQVRADPYVPPYTGPLDLDDYGRETDEMRRAYRDLHRTEPALRSAIDGKAAAVAALDVSVLPDDKDHPDDCTAAQFVDWTVSRSPHGWDGLILAILRPALIDGFSLAEKVLKGVDDSRQWHGFWGLKHVKARDTAHLQLRLDGYRNVLGVVNTVRGLRTYSPAKFIRFTHAELFDNPFGQSDLRAAYRAAGQIQDAYRLWYLALKRCGEPYLHGKYDHPAHRAEFEKALRALRAGGWAVTGPKDEIAVLDLAGAASFDAFERKVRLLREDIFLAVRGAYTPFMQSNSGAGETRGDTAVSQRGGSDPVEEVLARAVGRVLTDQLVPDLVRPNFGDRVGLPRVVLGGVNWGELRTRLDILERAKKLGLSVSARWAPETLQIPPAATPDDELGGPPQGGSKPGEAGPPVPRTFAHWDRSHLVLKEIIDKNGKRTHVWVRPDEPAAGSSEDDGFKKPSRPQFFDELAEPGFKGEKVITWQTWVKHFGDSPQAEAAFEAMAGDKDEITEGKIESDIQFDFPTKSAKLLADVDQVYKKKKTWDEITVPDIYGYGRQPPARGNAPASAPRPPSSNSRPGTPAPDAPPPLAAGDYRGYAALARRIWNQRFNQGVAEEFVAACKKNPFYASDYEYKELVDQLAARVRDAKIGGLSDPTRKLLLGSIIPDPEYLAGHRDTPAAIRELDQLRPKALSDYGLQLWLEDVRHLEGKINQRRYEAEIPRVYRYTAGILHGGLKTAGGTVEAIAHFDKALGGMWNLATDKDTQTLAIKALVDRLSDPTADNWGQLTAEIPLTVSGAAGAVKGAAKASAFTGRLVVKAPREMVELWRAMIRGGEDVALDVRPAGPVRGLGPGEVGSVEGKPGTAKSSTVDGPTIPRDDGRLPDGMARPDRSLSANDLEDLYGHRFDEFTNRCRKSATAPGPKIGLWRIVCREPRTVWRGAASRRGI